MSKATLTKSYPKSTVPSKCQTSLIVCFQEVPMKNNFRGR